MRCGWGWGCAQQLDLLLRRPLLQEELQVVVLGCVSWQAPCCHLPP
jgi:hypothetical protein